MSSESIDAPANRVDFVYRGGEEGGSVEIPAAVTHLRVDNSVTVVPEGAFQGLRHLVEADLPQGLIEIGDDAFSACKSLARINLPETLLKIGNGAFRGAGLTDVRLPDGLVDIGRSVFADCVLLKSIRIPSSVKVIPRTSFIRCKQLNTVELAEGLVGIESHAFHFCQSLERVNIPSSVRLIGEDAFYRCNKIQSLILPGELQRIEDNAFGYCEAMQQVTFSPAINDPGNQGPVSLTIGKGVFGACYDLAVMDLPDSVQAIGQYAFGSSSIQSFRSPPSVGRFDWMMMMTVRDHNLFSVEFPETLKEIEGFVPSSNLRNVAIPPNCRCEKRNLFWNVELVLKGRVDKSKVDLCKAFPSSNSAQIASALEKRFDGLPVHKLCYYQSYMGENALAELKRLCYARKLRSGMSTSRQMQDVLGMTPLHVLACSAKQNIHLYQVIIDAHPETLTMEDKWGDIPLLYAFWSCAPTEVIHMLAERQKKIFPDYTLDWKEMLVTLGRANASLLSLRRLVEAHDTHFADDELDIQGAVTELADIGTLLKSRMRFLLEYDISRRLAAMAVESWREGIEAMVQQCLKQSRSRSPHVDCLRNGDGAEELSALYSMLTLCEQLKEASSLLELALWKYKLAMALPSQRGQVAGEERHKKRAKLRRAAERDQCRISCGANVVVPNVLAYLLPSFE